MDLVNVSKWTHQCGCHNRSVAWETPMSKWAGERTEWVQEVTKCPTKKDEVIVALLKMTAHEASNGKSHRYIQQ